MSRRNVLAILDHPKNLGWMRDWVVGDVQLGFETTSSSGGLHHAARKPAVTVQ